MVRGFNSLNKKDQETLFWFLGVLFLFLIFLLVLIPITITESKAYIEGGLTSNAFVKDVHKSDGIYRYDVNYSVSNGDTLKYTLSTKNHYRIGHSIHIYYSKTNEFNIREFDEVNEYQKDVLIMSIVWAVIFSIALFTIYKPETALEFLN